MTREEAIKIIGCYDIGFYDLSGEKIPAEKLVEAFDMAIEALQDRPKDYVQIVRCKDCKFGVYEKGRGIYHIRCEILEFLFQDDDFCSYGERREESEVEE